jgi:polyisoprenoid-binding protein YceI
MKTLHRFAFAVTLLLLSSGYVSAQAADTPPSISGAPLPEGAPALPAPVAPSTPADTAPASPGVPPTPAGSSADPAAASAEAAAAPKAADGTAAAPAKETFAIDPVHSHVGFKVKHLFSNVTGRFNEFSGTISGDPAKPEEAQVNVDIRIASIDTKDAKRDQHLRSDEFFDVERFPTMSFVSRKVNRTGEDTAFVIGDLTLRGITREVILQTKYLGRGKGMTGRIHTGFEARTALKRSDFGLTWGKAIEGTQLVGDDIEIDLQIEAVEPKDEVAAPAQPPQPPERVLPEADGVAPSTEGTAPAAPAAAPSPAPAPATGESAGAKQEGESVPGTTETAPAAPQKPETGAEGSSGAAAAPAAGGAQ